MNALMLRERRKTLDGCGSHQRRFGARNVKSEHRVGKRNEEAKSDERLVLAAKEARVEWKTSL